MPLHWRRPITPEWQIPPAETRESAAQADEINSIDEALTGLKLVVRSERTTAWFARADRLLDKRLSIRPGRPAPVPVIPGPDRFNTTVNDYWENP